VEGRARSTARVMTGRLLARVLLALLLAVTTASAWVRLAQSGLSCADAPACYASKAARTAAEASAATSVARAVHRIAASAAGLAIVAMLVAGWRTGTRAQRGALVALAILAVALASLGRYTPSALPAVTLANLAGGMTMVATAAWLVAASGRRPSPGTAAAMWPWTVLALALIGMQVATGGMVSARDAAFACDGLPLCAGRLWPTGVGLDAFDPWRTLAPPYDAASRSDAVRRAVLQAHRLLALPTLAVLAGVGARAIRAGLAKHGAALLVAAGAQAALGIGQGALQQPLALVVLHNLVAALVLAVLAAILARSGAAQ